MKLRSYVAAKDYQIIKNWITDERMHDLWCAKRIPYPMTEDNLQEFLEKDAQEWGGKPYIATEEDSDIPVGFFIITVNNGANSAFFKCIMVDNSLRGKGYGTRMIEEMKRFAFDELGVSLVQLNVFDTNPGAKRCYEKAGFEVESFSEKSLAFGAESWGHYRMVAWKSVE